MNRKQERRERLMPGGIPRWIRCYDNDGKTVDRYTVVYTGNYTKNTGGQVWYVGMSGAPFHPQGFGQHGENDGPIDRPRYGHLGKRIKFRDLPEDCRRLVVEDYKELWDLE
jgi:hypothetical protein